MGGDGPVRDESKLRVLRSRYSSRALCNLSPCCHGTRHVCMYLIVTAPTGPPTVQSSNPANPTRGACRAGPHLGKLVSWLLRGASRNGRHLFLFLLENRETTARVVGFGDPSDDIGSGAARPNRLPLQSRRRSGSSEVPALPASLLSPVSAPHKLFFSWTSRPLNIPRHPGDQITGKLGGMETR